MLVEVRWVTGASLSMVGKVSCGALALKVH